MSLDLKTRLLRLGSIDLDELVRAAADTPTGACITGHDFITLYRFDNRSSCDRPQLGTESPYDFLEQNGLIVLGVQPNENGELALRGGSEAVVHMHLGEDGAPFVRKRISASSIRVEGSESRFLREVQWLAAQHHPHLFPQIRGFQRDQGRIHYDMEFIPRYTLSDRLVQGRLTTRWLLSTVSDAVDALRENLYSRTADRKQVSYVDVAEKRLALLAQHSPFYHALLTEGIVVGEEKLPPLSLLLNLIRESATYREVYRPEGGHMCHGDLTLDAILPPVVDGCEKIRFIDPNPGNCWMGADAGKLLMNCMTEHELVLRGDVAAVKSNNNNRIVHIKREARDPLKSEIYSTLAEWTLDYFSRRVGRIAVSELAIWIQAALHALAITSFHEIRVGGSGRALLFASRGAQMLAAGVRGDIDPAAFLARVSTGAEVYS